MPMWLQGLIGFIVWMGACCIVAYVCAVIDTKL